MLSVSHKSKNKRDETVPAGIIEMKLVQFVLKNNFVVVTGVSFFLPSVLCHLENCFASELSVNLA